MLILFVLHIRTHSFYLHHSPLTKILPIDVPLLKKMIKQGLPIGLAIFFECSLFSVVTLMISNHGTTILSGHEIAHNVAAIVFMIPLSIGMATTVRTGFLLGEGKPFLARQAGFCGIMLAFFCATISSGTMIVFSDAIAYLYTNNTEVAAIASLLICYAAVFQFSDATQVSSAGALRGYNDTRAAMLITFFAYWVVGLPMGYLLAETYSITNPMGAAGYWTGTISGLTMAALLLLSRFAIMSKKQLPCV
jgi:MATE family multidrug resistance protein